VNLSAGDGTTELTPEVNAIVVVAVGGRIPIGGVVDVVVVDAVAADVTSGTRSNAVVHAIQIGVFESEIVAVASDRPRGIVAGEMVYGHFVRLMPVDAVDL